MKMLGHRDIKTILLYTQLVHFESDDNHSAMAETIAEKKTWWMQALSTSAHIKNVMLFRKRR